VTVEFPHNDVSRVPADHVIIPTTALSRRPLIEVFAEVPDPRDPRGVRHSLATVLTLTLTAVLAGSRTLLAIAEWIQDADRDALSRLGIGADQVLPSESTIRRSLALLDADDLDARMAAWMAVRVGQLAGQRLIAFDGKTVRGARTADGVPHLVAAFDQSAGAVLANSRSRPRATRSPRCATCSMAWTSPAPSSLPTPCIASGRPPATSPARAPTTC